MQLIYSKTALKSLKKFPKNKQIKIVIRISALKLNHQVGKKLKGQHLGQYSLKIWPYRVIYEVIKRKILIHKIQHRQGAYK